MSVISWPNLKVSSLKWSKFNQAEIFRSGFGSQALVQGAALWDVELVGVPMVWTEANAAVAFLESLDGLTNQLELWNLTQPVPAGTMRGTMTLSADASQGAVSLSITAGVGQAGTTLKKGDLLGLGSGLTQQVVRVSADATANGSGVIVVSIGTPLRNAFSSGAGVTWNKPKALFRQKSVNDGIEYTTGVGHPWSLSLIEDWRP